MAKIVTADNLREESGKSTIIKGSPHEGPLRRPTEFLAGNRKLDGYSSRTGKTPADFRKEREKLTKQISGTGETRRG